MKLTLFVFVLSYATVASADDAAKKEKLHMFISFATVAKREAGRPGGPRGPIVNKCLRAYELAIEAGVPPEEPIKEGDLDGTMESVKKSVCEPAADAANAKEEARTAPYKKVLKADKYDTWKGYSAALILPGNADASDPAKLAAATYWFVDTSPPEHCANGSQKHRVHRYQFNAAHKLVKTTDKDYCGSPPASAYK